MPVRLAVRSLSVALLVLAAVFVYRAMTRPASYVAEATVALAEADTSLAAATTRLETLAATQGSADGAEFLPVPGIRLVAIHATSGDPVKASDVANSIAAAYVRQAEIVSGSGHDTDLQQVQRERAGLESDVSDLEQQIDMLRHAPGPVASVVLARRVVTEAGRARAAVEARQRAYRQVADGASIESAEPVAGDPLVQALRRQLQQLEDYRSDMTARLGAGSRTVARINIALDQTRQALSATEQRIANDIKADYEAAANRERIVAQQLASVRTDAAESASLAARTAALFTSLEQARTRLDALKARERDLQRTVTADDSGARPVARADVPVAAVNLDLARAELTTLAGLVLLALSFVRRPSRSYAWRPSTIYAHARTRSRSRVHQPAHAPHARRHAA